MKTPIKQSKFNGGEISPFLYGDTSVPKYGASLKTCRNWLPIAQGPVLTRPGTQYIGTLAGKVRIKGFALPDRQSYLLEFSDLTLRFWRAGSVVQTLATPWTEAMLPYLKFAQAGNTITVTYGGQAGDAVGLPPTDVVHSPGTDTWSLKTTDLKTPTFALSGEALVFGNILGTSTDAMPTWDVGRSYLMGSRVTRNNTSYVSIQRFNTGNDPATPGSIYWALSVDATHPGIPIQYAVTHVFRDNLTGIVYESPITKSISLNDALSADRPVPVQETPGTPVNSNHEVLFSRLYRGNNGVWGFVADLATMPEGIALYIDQGAAPDYTQQPPKGTNPFLVAGTTVNYPAVVGHYEQRRYFMRSQQQPQGVWASNAGNLYRYDRGYPGADTDSLFFVIASDVLEEVRAFAPMRVALILTSNGEWTLRGANNAAVTRTNYDFKRQSVWGSSWLDPVVIGNGVLFNTAKSNMVRELYPLNGTYIDVWDGDDLTYQSRHLFENMTLVDWAYQATPYSVVWAVRSDGLLLSLTYYKISHNSISETPAPVVAWAQHPIAGGTVENVTVVPEGTEDAVYLVVRRTVNGATVRYLERIANFARPTDARLDKTLDAHRTYDGRNATASGATALKLTGGTTYSVGDVVTCRTVPDGMLIPTAFDASDVGNDVVFDPDVLQPNGTLGVRCRIVGFTSPSVVTVQLLATLTTEQRALWASASGSVAWALARCRFDAGHLAGYALDSGEASGARGVAVLADGNTVNVTLDGTDVVLPNPTIVATVGLTYNRDLEFLDAYHPNAEIRGRFKSLTRMGLHIANARALWAGRNLDDLYPCVQRSVADGYGPIPYATGYFEVDVSDNWNKDGSAAVRQWEPLSATLVSVYREMELGGA